jgi:hypothetical protein
MAWLCLAVLLMASIVQVTHLCGFSLLDTCHTPQFHAVSSSGTVCLICLMAQPATVVLLFVAFFSNLPARPRVSFRKVTPNPLLESFELYVRPPPVS